MIFILMIELTFIMQGQALVEEGMLMTEGGWSPVSHRTQALLEQGVTPEAFDGSKSVSEKVAADI